MSVLARATVVLQGDIGNLQASFAQAENLMRQTGRRMEEVGRDLTTKVTLPLAAIGGAAVQAAAAFDNTLRKTAALTSMTTEETFGLSDAVRELGIQYASSGRDAAEALFFIATPSLTVAQTMDVLKESLKGAVIGLGEAKSIALGSVGAMNAYAKTGLTATRATEILAAGVKFGRFEAQELVPVLGRLTGIAAAMGISFEDVVGTLAALTLTGSNTYEASTQLSAIMSSLMGTSEDGEKVLRSYGLSLEALRKTAAQPGGLIQVFRELEAATAGNIEKLEDVFPNIRAMRGVMNALAQDSAVVDRAIRGVRDSTGLLDKAFKTFADAPAYQIKVAFAELKDALISLGQVLVPTVVPAFKQVSAVIKRLVEQFAALDPEMRAFIVTSAALAAALGPVLLVLGSVVKILGALQIGSAIAGILGLRAAFVSLFTTIIPNMVFLSGIEGAFAAAALAGTGFRGVLAGLVPALTLAFTAMAPWLAGAAIVGGLGLIVYKWADMKMEVSRVKRAIEESTTAMNTMMAAVSPASAQKKVEQFDKRIADLTEEMHKHERAALDAGRATTFAADATSTKSTPVIKENAEAHRTSAAEIRQTIAVLMQHRGVLAQVAAAYAAVTPEVKGAAVTVAKVEPWLIPAQEALAAFGTQLKNAAAMHALLGGTFDFTKAKAKAYGDVVQALVAAGVPFDTVIGQNGETLRQLAEKFKAAEKEISDAEKAEEAWTATMEVANAAIEAAITPTQQYDLTVAALNAAVEAGAISWEQYDAAVAKARETMEKGSEMSRELKQAITDMAADAVQNFITFGREGKKNFHDFAHDAMQSIARLIIQIQIMKWLVGSGSSGLLGTIFGGKFAEGGFLSGGQIGLVGERGPELISGGRSGVTVTPMPSVVGAAAGEGGGTIVVELNVNAIDSKGVAEFFEQNEDLVAGTFMRARQKSSHLMRRG